MKAALTITAVLLMAAPASAVDYTRVASCYFQERQNSPPRWSLDKCEIHSSTAQGIYAYQIIFNEKREYIAKGGHPLKAWDEAEATLNGMPARFSRKNGYFCWSTEPGTTPHRVCFEN